MFGSGTIDNPMIPSYVQFYPTLRCNYSCYFCFNRKLPMTDDVTVHDFEKIAGRLHDLGVRHIDLLGGEPTLHPDLLQLVEIVDRYGLKATLSSNGTRVDVLNGLSKRYADTSLRIGISLNRAALPEDLHNYVVKTRPVLKSIFLKNAVFPWSYESYIRIPGIEYFLLYMDIVDVSDIRHSVPFHVFYREMSALKDHYSSVDGVYCSGFIPDSENYPVLNYVRCPAGTTKLSVLPSGAVYPCYLFFRYKEFELGNLLRDDFNTIRQNPILDYFRNFEKNMCPNTSCRLFQSCHGGCPALSYTFYKDLDSPDPRCVEPDAITRKSTVERFWIKRGDSPSVSLDLSEEGDQHEEI